MPRTSSHKIDTEFTKLMSLMACSGDHWHICCAKSRYLLESLWSDVTSLATGSAKEGADPAGDASGVARVTSIRRKESAGRVRRPSMPSTTLRSCISGPGAHRRRYSPHVCKVHIAE